MTLCFRSESPVLHKKEIITDGKKIHRIVLNSEANCILANIVSPECIWFKLENHICEKLRICKRVSENDPLESLEKEQPKDFDYVMAPIEEDVYARARIVCREERGKHIYMYVHFIDEGHGAWMNVRCLAKMEPKLYTHPWQAFPIALFKMSKKRASWPELGQTSVGQWPEGLREKLVDIMEEYPLFRVKPAIGRYAVLNNYNEYIRADVFGMNLPDKEDGSNWVVGDSIAHMLALSSSAEHIVFPNLERKMYNALSLKLERPTKSALILTDAELCQMPVWRRRSIVN